MKKFHSTKLTILFRKRHQGAFSIEELFTNVLNKLDENTRMPFEKVSLPHDGKGLLNKVRNIIFVFKLRNSWVHVTGEVYYTILFNRKVIITIHDIALALSGSLIKRTIIKFFWYWIPCRIAKAITVISETSKSELVKFIGVDPQKVRVIPNPVSNELRHLPLKKGRGNKILTIGTKPNKNLERLFRACEDLDVQLHIIGKLSFEQQSLLNESNLKYSNDYDLTFEEVKTHYENCDIVAFVSTYEGFGMPIIEAQAVGRPVITSNVSSMPEVAGGGALLVDPFSVDQIRNGILQLLEDSELKKSLVEKGKANVKKYNLRRIAELYKKVYKDLIFQ